MLTNDQAHFDLHSDNLRYKKIKSNVVVRLDGYDWAFLGIFGSVYDIP